MFYCDLQIQIPGTIDHIFKYLHQGFGTAIFNLVNPVYKDTDPPENPSQFKMLKWGTNQQRF